MRVRLLAASAIASLTAATVPGLAASPAAAAGTTPVTIVIDSWVPRDLNCHQQLAVRLVTGTALAPTGKLTVTNASDGTYVAGADVTSSATQHLTMPCRDNVDRDQIKIQYSGDTAYAAAMATTETCETSFNYKPDLWAFLYSLATPQPNYCYDTRGTFGLRSGDGRLFPDVSSYTDGSSEVGDAQTINFHADGTRTLNPQPLSGNTRLSVDGHAAITKAVTDHADANYTLRNAALGAGAHRWTLRYTGGPHWAPLTYTGSVTVTKAAVDGGDVTVRRWKMRIGQRPTATLRLPAAGDAPFPTGPVTFYYGKTRAKTINLTASNRGTVTLRLPKVRKRGQFELRFIYAGNAMYKRFDSHLGPGGQQYIQVRKR